MLIKSGQNKKDSFGIHTDISKALKKLIENSTLERHSYTIGLVGPWGCGKSFIIDNLKAYLNKEKCHFVYINTWKYSKAPLLRTVLWELCDQIKDKGIPTTEELEKSFYTNEEKQIESFHIVYWLILGLWALLSIIAVLFYEPMNKALNLLPPLFLVGISLFYEKILPKFIFREDKYIHKSMFSIEQFEKKFDQIINTLKDKKLVIIFDDIDRCNSEDSYQILSDIKTYLEKHNCVYIIPFDEAPLKEHFKFKFYPNAQLSTSELYSGLVCKPDGPTYIDFYHEFIDKLFDSYIRIPDLKEHDRDRFIEESLKKLNIQTPCTDDIYKIKQILFFAYKGLTPRQIERFINDFAMYYYLAQEIDGKKHYLLSNISFFTLMMAIKQRWPEAQNTFLSHPGILKDFYNGQENLSLEESLQYFLSNVKECIDPQKALPPFVYLRESENELTIRQDYLFSGKPVPLPITNEKQTIISNCLKNLRLENNLYAWYCLNQLIYAYDNLNKNIQEETLKLIPRFLYQLDTPEAIDLNILAQEEYLRIFSNEKFIKIKENHIFLDKYKEVFKDELKIYEYNSSNIEYDYEKEISTNQKIENIDAVLFVALYMSKYEHQELFKTTQSDVFQRAAEVLRVKATTLKFNRDWFDTLVANKKKGFKNQQIPKYIQSFYDKYNDLSKDEHLNIVQEILDIELNQNYT
ncbi:MAG: KAP P-loop protein [uncultured bacterium]|nr:MAG: KAP P-loop protein [uncultured bacterium]